MKRFRLPMAIWRVPRWPDEVQTSNDDQSAIVVMYHAVGRWRTDPWGLHVSQRNFVEHIAAIAEHCTPMGLDDLVVAAKNNALPHRAVAVTFDDGYAQTMRNVVPALERFKVPATVFIPTGYVGSQREFWWDELEQILLKSPQLPHALPMIEGVGNRSFTLNGDGRYGVCSRWSHRHWRAWHEDVPTSRHTAVLQLREQLRMMSPPQRESILIRLRIWAEARTAVRESHRCVTLAELRAAAESPMMDVGAHTVEHASLGGLDETAQRYEINQSKAWLEQTLQQSVTSFACPFGGEDDFNATTMQLLADAGFGQSCTTIQGNVVRSTPPLQLPRRTALDWTGRELIERMSGWFNEVHANAM